MFYSALARRALSCFWRTEPVRPEARKWQNAINAVYEAAGEPLPPAFVAGDGELAAAAAPQRRAYGRAEFFGQPLATVVRRILTDHGPQNENELYDKLIEGGYRFEATSTDAAKNGLKISLGKNPAFGRTATGFYTIVPDGQRVPRKASAPKGKDGNGATPKDANGTQEQTKDETSGEAAATTGEKVP